MHTRETRARTRALWQPLLLRKRQVNLKASQARMKKYNLTQGTNKFVLVINPYGFAGSYLRPRKNGSQENGIMIK